MERLTARYEQALTELGEHASLMAFQGPAGFYAWQRLELLVTRLRTVFDAYELEGDVAPARREVAAYMNDMQAHNLKVEQGITAYLTRFLAELDAPARVLAIETHVARAAMINGASFGAGYLAIAPAELAALHEQLLDRETHGR